MIVINLNPFTTATGCIYPSNSTDMQKSTTSMILMHYYHFHYAFIVLTLKQTQRSCFWDNRILHSLLQSCYSNILFSEKNSFILLHVTGSCPQSHRVRLHVTLYLQHSGAHVLSTTASAHL